ncbi:MAG: hypothetical protein LBB11_03790 [Puniceicoccales bacterium]|jgi:hypothetical protein|nr:hypothetical protein [Puniceicoccales bacterium]
MDELIDLTDKLARKHGPLAQHFYADADTQSENRQLDYFHIFFLTFSGLVIITEPLFVFILY